VAYLAGARWAAFVCVSHPCVARRAPGGPSKAERGADAGPAAERSGAALISYTAGFGSGSDPGQDPGLPKAPSREADGLTHLRPQHVDLSKRQLEPSPWACIGHDQALSASLRMPRSADPIYRAGDDHLRSGPSASVDRPLFREQSYHALARRDAVRWADLGTYRA